MNDDLMIAILTTVIGVIAWVWWTNRKKGGPE
jgi:hypothetical protein